jgi:hypothetical protein
MENHGDVQKYRRTDVQTYRRTEVQWYRSKVAQTNVAIERMVAVGFRKRDPSLNY